MQYFFFLTWVVFHTAAVAAKEDAERKRWSKALWGEEGGRDGGGGG